MLEWVDYVILFLGNFFAFVLALNLVLTLILKKIFQNHVPHLINDAVDAIVDKNFKKFRAAKGADARWNKDPPQKSREVKNSDNVPGLDKKWKELGDVIGQDLVGVVMALGTEEGTWGVKIRDLALRNPAMAKGIVEKMAQSYAENPGLLEHDKNMPLNNYPNIEFQD